MRTSAGRPRSFTPAPGSVTLKVLPLPGELWTVAVPLWASAMERTMLRPRPVPPLAGVRDSSPR